MTTILESVRADLSGLLSLGFSDHQARTIITARTMEAANISKQITPATAPAVTRTAEQHGTPWTASDVKLALQPELTDAEVGRRLGRTRVAVTTKRKHLREEGLLASRR